jgi:hypothetical protein
MTLAASGTKKAANAKSQMTSVPGPAAAAVATQRTLSPVAM